MEHLARYTDWRPSTFRDFLACQDPTTWADKIVLEGNVFPLFEQSPSPFIHRLHRAFLDIWNGGKIPKQIKEKAQEQFVKMRDHFSELMAANQLKILTAGRTTKFNLWQIKIADKWRAVGVERGHEIVWFWIGPRETMNNYENVFAKSPVSIPNRTVSNPQRPARL